MNDIDSHKYFYAQPTQVVAEQLVRCKLSCITHSGLISGIINETEAYTQEDPASHSYLGISQNVMPLCFKSLAQFMSI